MGVQILCVSTLLENSDEMNHGPAVPGGLLHVGAAPVIDDPDLGANGVGEVFEYSSRPMRTDQCAHPLGRCQSRDELAAEMTIGTGNENAGRLAGHGSSIAPGSN